MSNDITAIPEQDRNVLFAIIASRLNFVNAHQIGDAFKSLDDDKNTDLGKILVSMGHISEENRALISPLVEVEIAEHKGDVNATLASFGGDDILESIGGIYIDDDGEVRSVEMSDTHSSSPKDTQQAKESVERVTREHTGRYKFKSEYGKGGIGRVLLVFDEHIGRDVALKELLGQRVDGTTDGATKRKFTSKAMIRFLREARITGQLEHPGIVPVYEVGERKDGSYYYTMKLVRGVTLHDKIRAADSLFERLMLLSNVLGLCQAMAYAHDKGVIHRDIKPQNIMVGEFGETVVLDWGLAKAKDAPDERAEDIAEGLKLIKMHPADKTIAGSPLGTPSFMSPEQAQGLLNEVDEKSDVWSLGGVLYEVLTGRPPFTGDTAYEVMGKVMKDPVTPVREIEPGAPAELIAICEKCLEKDRDKRYKDAEELAKDLARFQAGGLVSAYDYSMGELVRRWVKKRWPVLATASVGLIILVIVAAVSFARIRTERNLAVEQKKIAEKNEKIAHEQRNLAEQREIEAHRNLAQAYYQYGVRAENEKRFMDARVYYAKSLALQGPAEARDGLFREAGSPIRIILDQSLSGHEGRVWTTDFSSDDNLVATGSCKLLEGQFCSEGEVKIWSADTGKPQKTLTGHEGHIWSVSFVPGTQKIITGAEDNVVRVWSLDTGKVIQVLEGTQRPGPGGGCFVRWEFSGFG